MDDFGSGEWLAITVIGLAITLWILYNIIKAGVKAGILEAHSVINPPKVSQGRTPVPTTLPLEAQLELNKKYENGEITFDEYQAKWAAK